MSERNVSRDLQTLRLPAEVVAAWLQDFSRLTGEADLTAPLWWLDDAKLRATCDEMAFAPAIHDAFAQAAALLRQQDRAWQTLIHLAARVLTQPRGDLRTQAYMRPGPAYETWGMLADLYRPMVCLTMLPAMIAHHRKLGVDAQITRDTADDLPLWMEDHHRKHGRWGTCDSTGWFCVHLNGELFRLGRLQYEPCTLQGHYHVLINRQNQSVAMMLANQPFRADGQYATADHGIDQDAPGNWTTRFTETSVGYTGHIVDAQGFVRRESQTLPRPEWKILAREGDPALSVHIPARGRLDPAACEASFIQAAQFFRHHFPQFNAKVFCCSSWLMDPQLALLEQGRSNLGQFVKLFQSVPHPHGNSDQMFERVFDNQTDIPTLPRDNSLRRGVLAHLEAGGRWRSANGYRLIP